MPVICATWITASIVNAEPAPPSSIKQWLLPNEKLRQKLTIKYLAKHSVTRAPTGNLERDVRMIPKVIVLHWTGGGSLKSAWNTFAPATLSGRKKLQRAGALNVGAHFLVDRDGTTYRMMDETRILRHCIGLNHVSIGVENIGDGKRWPLTPAQLRANIDLVRYLSAKFPITHLIGHHEYRGLENHPYFSEKNPKYRTIKIDPGAKFMTKVRRRVTDLGLKGAMPLAR